MIKLRFIFQSLVLLMLNWNQAIAQDSTGTSALKKGYFKFVPLPIIASTPTTGFMFGVAPGAYWLMGDPSTTSLSSALGSIAYTSKKQLLITAKAYTFFNHNRWSMTTDLRYFITSQPTYGLGTGPQSAKPVSNGYAEYTDEPYSPISTAQMMEFNYLRIHNTVNKHFQGGWYAGIGYHFDFHYKINDHLLQLDSTPYTITSHYAYQYSIGVSAKQYTSSGFSLNGIYDSRDNAVNPYKGRFAFVNLRLNPTLLGSTKNTGLLWLESREYLHLNKSRPRHLIGFWNYGWFAMGNVSYLDLPGVGWDLFGRSGRAYTQGRFRGPQLIYNEIEYRVPLLKKKDWLGAVVFVNGTTASNSTGTIHLFEYYDIGYGAGLRFMVSKKSRANLNLDYAFGRYGAHGFYLNLNEVF